MPEFKFTKDQDIASHKTHFHTFILIGNVVWFLCLDDNIVIPIEIKKEELN